jgi:hypothetical protein
MGLTMTATQAIEHQERVLGRKLQPYERSIITGLQTDNARLLVKGITEADKLLRKTRQMNKTEAEFGRILEGKKQRGELTDYKFEALRLRWGESMWYKPDFVARGANGVTYLYEVKGGHIWSRDQVRFKGCRAEWRHYKNFHFEMWQKKAGQWTRLE